jgi:hypothetical protein
MQPTRKSGSPRATAMSPTIVRDSRDTGSYARGPASTYARWLNLGVRTVTTTT